MPVTCPIMRAALLTKLVHGPTSSSRDCDGLKALREHVPCAGEDCAWFDDAACAIVKRR